ncbi:hypothetical protein K435DRAFT_845290 [Dendrothele bispora CBS 962.96]|uniref:Uncharacterized protein n=1 Tax=Dendrothele bispora (strain CBS 962.96) TaxID=1314807 RepID=A0A4S8KVH1_DENBC|nr:hypothetical protein K435DRAFT_845290 [Dendrothele bispora CBS 962.96]
MISLAGGEKQRCFVVSGGAGTGKTHFLQYILIKRLLDGKATTIQFDKDHIFWFNNDGVFVVQSWNQPDLLSNLLTNNHLIHLVDVPLNPEDVLLQAVGVMVTTSSPFDLASSYKWMDRQVPTACVLWMEPPSWEETYVVCKHFAPPFFKSDDLTQVPRLFLTYGPSISMCLNLAGSPSREAVHIQNINYALHSLKYASHWLPLPDAEGGYARYTSFLFGFHSPTSLPESERQINKHDNFGFFISQCFPLSSYIIKRLFELALQSNPRQGKNLLLDLTRNPRTRDAAELFFELAVSHRLRNGPRLLTDRRSSSVQYFNLSPLPPYFAGQPSSNVVGFNIRSLSPDSEVNVQFSLSQLPEMIRKYPGHLLTPLQNSWPSVKYIMVRYPGDDSQQDSELGNSLASVENAHIYVILPTLDMNPVLLVEELEKIRQAIPDGFLGSKWDKWSLIVVQLTEQAGEEITEPVVLNTKCPSSMMDYKEKNGMIEWKRRLEQFTLKVSAEQLFGPVQGKKMEMDAGSKL